MATTVAPVWPTHCHPVFPLPFALHPTHAGSAKGPISPLMIADRLITLAQDADRAGYRETASHLVGLIDSVLDSHPLG